MAAGGPETVRQLLAEAAASIDRLDAEVLLAHSLALPRMELLLQPQRRVADSAPFRQLVARRRRHEPVAYLTGEREFWSLPLRVTADTLVPRPDSETLIEEAQRCFGAAGPKTILDLGTGSGALLLAALSEWPAARGVGVDRSAAALLVAGANAARLGFDARARFSKSDWFSAVRGRFDLVLCNPPYVPDGDVLMADVGDFEPALALRGGADGLDCYRLLLPQLGGHLAEGGVGLFEFGAGQERALMALALALASASGLAARLVADLSGRPRVLVLTRPGAGGKDLRDASFLPMGKKPLGKRPASA